MARSDLTNNRSLYPPPTSVLQPNGLQTTHCVSFPPFSLLPSSYATSFILLPQIQHHFVSHSTMESKPKPLPELFNAVKDKFSASIGPEKWYLVVASALVTCSNPFQLGQLYTYLTDQPENASPERRRFLDKRLREFVMKQWVNIGVPKAATALFGLIEAEKEGDRDLSFTKSHIHLDAANREKGTAFLKKLYGPERAANLFATWGDDFEWLTKDIVYGMFYGDESVLEFMETELVNYIAIVCLRLSVTRRPIVRLVRPNA